MNIDSAAWLVVITLMTILEQNRVGQKEIENEQFEKKNSIRKFSVEAMVCAERDKEK